MLLNSEEKDSRLKKILDYCLTKEGSALFFPFGKTPAVIKINGKIFAEVYVREINPQITLKCHPVLAELLRQKYRGVVIPGYHVPNRNKPYWNTVLLDSDEIPEQELFEMIDHSYSEVVKKRRISQKTDSSIAF
jgi:predicted DNA-binding protein (MmcQ/YjbR family)